MRKVFTENLPKWKTGMRIGKFNWQECIEFKVKFIYDDIEGEMKIIGYDNKSRNLYILYEEKEYKIYTSNFISCQLGTILEKRKLDFYYKIGTVLKDEKRNLVITEQIYIPIYNKDGTLKCKEKAYKYYCNSCTFNCGKHFYNKIKAYREEFYIREYDLIKGIGCACCSGHIVVEGINDIPTTASWLIPYFQGGYDEAKLYTSRSGQKIYPICPDCGQIKDKPVSIGDIFNRKTISCICRDKISVPNKIMYNLLSQLNVEFETEYSPEWIKPLRYDFYISSLNTIIEMDGGLGHGKGNFKNNMTSEESKAIDDYKDEQARLNNIEVIRVDCDYPNIESRFNFIKQNILSNNRLNKFFDLNKIDWLNTEEFICNNLMKKVCEIKKNNPNITTNELSINFKISPYTIRDWLKRGTKLGWCDYNGNEEISKNVKKLNCKSAKPILVFKNGIFIKEFSSRKELELKSKEIFGVKLLKEGISNVCNGKIEDYKGYFFKYK